MFFTLLLILHSS